MCLFLINFQKVKITFSGLFPAVNVHIFFFLLRRFRFSPLRAPGFLLLLRFLPDIIPLLGAQQKSGGGRRLRETPSVGTVGLIQLELTCVRCCGRGNRLVYLGVLPGLRHPGAQSQVCYRHASEHAAFDCGEGAGQRGEPLCA